MSCCSKAICDGCSYANKIRGRRESLEQICPFCRHPVPATDAEIDANRMKRVEANDPVALRRVGKTCYDEADYGSACEYLTKAAGLGDVEALYHLSVMYKKGDGVEKDEKMAVYHMEEAAIAGHPLARFNLGIYEWNSGNKERAVKHFVIAANLGDVKSVETLKKGYLRGVVSKDDFAAALRAHQAAVDATKNGEGGGSVVNAASGNADIDMSFCCASCGIAEVDDIKLTTCDANNCKLVRYCSVACQRDHNSQHKEECKKFSDEVLFAQPESTHFGDCPICFLPLAIYGSKRAFMTCCSKVICDGCFYANGLRERNSSLEPTCPFCRHPLLATKAESDANIMKRVEVDDPIAMQQMGIRRYSEGYYGSAFGYLTKAARVGDATAHSQLALMYMNGHCVEMDRKKAVYHLEEAAIAGNPTARFYLGSIEWNIGNKERAMKHYIIAANLGYDKSVEILKKGYLRGVVSKDDFDAALRAHQAAVDATKSPQREAAAEIANVACQRDHRSQHKEECKKRVAELRDELLFVQPESSHYGDCPICCLPLPLDGDGCKRAFMTCCSKLICFGCAYANTTRFLEGSLKRSCPFCRHPVPATDAEADANIMKRVEANDPAALRKMGIRRYDEGDYRSAFEYLTKAARMGDAVAHDYLSLMYWKGTGVEKDEKKVNYHAEEAAIAGHPTARHNLGAIQRQ
ncbi:Sel1-like repeat family protein [Skeletonema marinoi]|uniref:Sel1-like repeat family protein n=1 Tax=Skeletonema marinoi TaxID=267567 RepID=A0AAD8Y2M2_9STRA|nr:Sel1-like repeat family protein [Skeletonema marinoi]